jgi:hypothetical protein
LLERAVDERLRHGLEPGDLNASKHRVEFLSNLVRRVFSASDEAEEQIDVGLEKTQAVDSLHEVCFGPAAEFVSDDQGLDVFDDRLARMLLAQPRANDPRAAK